MNAPELDLLIKEKMQKYLPPRPVQVMHCGAIVLVSIAIGIFNLPAEPLPSSVNAAPSHQGFGEWFGVYLAFSGLTIYFVWTFLRAAKARKEANAEFLAASPKESAEK